jgi:hypothetical protein
MEDTVYAQNISFEDLVIFEVIKRKLTKARELLLSAYNSVAVPEKLICSYSIMRGHAVAQLVEELTYKPEGRGFDSR